ncbi:outer membrane lipoprotein-sorting protein [Stigmatella sp. ncwal1]|uniref:Outer membrane lipoprotein-sorting protein n=1 Tax=Stigmatella ashevillensis TaxID=2995309 RepID=A0ABT5D8F1_9BACT|nr:outer membrane lipoprotein-sorting protein [Stigmatella ashevillena]MDC0708557.1 outer membrane lipoprotein-sorting protein [Stigmatella ashevillena]
MKEILARVDAQLTFDTRAAVAKMIIVSPDETREKELKLFARGQQDSFIIFLKPDRDKGTRFLKLGGQLWTYFPRTEKTVKLSGHMLRQSVMGSDLSYEDMTENKTLLDNYDGELLPQETLDGESVYVVHLKAKNKGVSYAEIKQWISKTSLLPVKEERYATTGKLLKQLRLADIEKIGERFYPKRFIMEDKLKQGTRTELVLSDIKFGADVPTGIFDVRNLERTSNF